MRKLRGTEPTVFERRAPSAAAVDHALAGAAHQVFWLDGLTRPAHPELIDQHAADLVIVGAGYTGLWTAIRAKERDPGRRVIILEAGQVGWAASGRNGGFCEASLTHGEENGRSRWPEEYDRLERLGRENLAGIVATVERYAMDVELERTGTLSVATEDHQIAWLAEEAGFLDGPATRELVDSPTFLAGSWDRDDTVLVHPGKLVLELARVATDLGVQIFEQSRVEVVDEGPVVRTARGEVHADHVVLATNVFPSLLRRNRLQTVPVYDYVLVTEPLSTEQKAAIGWQGRQGLADLANHFHYYRLTADDRILFGGYDAVYHWGGRVRSAYEDRPETYAKLAESPADHLPAAGGSPDQSPVGRCHRHLLPVLRVLRHRAPGTGGVRGRLHRARSGSLPVRRRRDAGSSRRRPHRADRAGHGAGAPAPVPPGAAGFPRHPVDGLVDAPGRSPPGPPQSAAQGFGRRRNGLRLLSLGSSGKKLLRRCNLVRS